MRILFLFLSLLPTCAWANVIPLETKVTEVTLHPHVAAIERRATIQVPKGQHRLVLLGIPQNITQESLRIELNGMERQGLIYRDEFSPPHDYVSQDVKDAIKAVEEIEQKISVVEEQAAAARLPGQAANATLHFLQNLGSNEGLAQNSAETLRDIAQMIGQEALTASQAAQSAEIKAERIERQLAELEEKLIVAEQTLEAIALEDAERLYLAVDAVAAEAGAVEIHLSYLAEGVSEWMPVYDLRLGTQPESQVLFQRDAMVQQSTGENWRDVTLHLTTASAIGQTKSHNIYSNRLSISAPQPKLATDSYDDGNYANLAEPALIEPVIVGDWSLRSEGAAVVYTYDKPVSIASGADILRLELDHLSLPAEIVATATPRYDDTAYRVAKLTNTSGQEILQSDFAGRYVGDTLVGIEPFPGLVPGQEAELGFGPIKGLRVSRDVLDRSEGDTGIISRSNQKVEQVEFEIENLTQKNWPLRLTDRVPYSEQEDLEITWTANPQPTDQNVDKKRGILAWKLDVPAGTSQTIRLNSQISWPQDMILQ